jgi:hypothetical protein
MLIFTIFASGEQNINSNISAPAEALDSKESNRTWVFRREIDKGLLGYYRSLDRMIRFLEKKENLSLYPKNYPKIMIRLDASAGPGLQVSNLFLDALLEILRLRSYKKEMIGLLTVNFSKLNRAPGFRSITENGFYKGHKIHSHRDNRFYAPTWYHDSPMPPKVHDRAKFYLEFPNDREKRIAEERKSYLPAVLLEDNVYWINLAVIMDDSNLGILGASSNMSLEMVSNARRFREDPTLGAAAITEILAIPEIWEKRIFSIVDLSRFQFAGGDEFHAEFLGGDPVLLMSRNPFAVDSVAWASLSDARKQKNFNPRNKEEALIFEYSESLELGQVMDPVVFNVP